MLEPPRLSTIARDPYLRAIFDRAERDDGHVAAIMSKSPTKLGGGAAEHEPESHDEKELAFA